MTMTYATVTAKLTAPGSDIPIVGSLVALPLTKASALAFPRDRFTLGPVSSQIDEDGTVELKIPVNSSAPSLLWRLTVVPKSNNAYDLSWDIGSYEITADLDLTTLENAVEPIALTAQQAQSYVAQMQELLDQAEANGGSGSGGVGKADLDPETQKLLESQVPLRLSESNLSASSEAQFAGRVVDPASVGADVWCLVGQSNEVGSNSDINLTYFEVPDYRIKQFPGSGAFMGQAIAAVDPLIHHGGATGVSHSTGFAKQYLSTVPDNRSVLLVCAAHGETGFTTSSLTSPPAGYSGGQGGSWDPANGSGGVDLVQFAIDQTLAALALDSNNRFAGFLWLQGEKDASTLTQAQYAAKLDALIVKLRGAIPGAANAPFVLGQMVPEGISGPLAYAGRDGINAAHIDTPRRVTRTAFGYGPTGYGTGTITPVATHYTAAGQRILAVEMFRGYRRALVNVTGTAPLPPTGVTLAQSGTSLTVTWNRPYCRFTDFIVEYRVNGGSWTTLAHTASIDRTQTITGLTLGAAVDVRVSTVNEQGTSAPSGGASLTLVNLPGQVTNLSTGTTGSTSVPLTWTAVGAATSYQTQYKASSSSTWLKGPTTTGTTIAVTGLTKLTAYDFDVIAANAAGSGTPSATASATTADVAGLIDDTGVAAWAAWGLRKLRAGYTGSAIRVRRSSDNTETDIGFVSGNLDTATLMAFAGSGSAYIKTWYDQSIHGAGWDWVQTTAASQARIVNAGTLDTVNGKPAAHFDGADDVYIDTTTGHLGIYAAGACTMGAVTNIDVNASSTRSLFTEGGAGTTQVYNLIGAGPTGGGAAAFTNIRSDDATNLVNNLVNLPQQSGVHTRWATDDAYQVYRWTDAVSAGPFAYDVSRSSKTFTPTRRAFGANFTNQFFGGYVSEVVLWSAVLNADQLTAGQANQKSYYGTA